MTTTNTRIQWIDTAKGIGIILVVYGHVLVGLHSSSDFNLPDVFFHNSFGFIWSFHMHLFFFLAGIFAVKSLSKRSRFDFVMHKVKMIAYPYLVWSLVQGLLQMVMGKFVNSNISFMDILKIPYKPLPQQHFWFLYVLFIFFVIMAFFYTNKYSLLILFFASIVLFFSFFSSDIRVVQKIKTFFIFFMFGSICSKIPLERLLMKITKKINWYIMLFLIIFHIALFFLVYTSDFRNVFTMFLFSLLGILMVIIYSCFLDMRCKSSLLNFMGKYSLQIYILHSMFLAASRIFLSHFLGIQNVFLHILFGLLCGLCFPLLIGFIVHKNNYNYIFCYR
jgi:fucose 4-O-acetylase-like acetyltransferase